MKKTHLIAGLLTWITLSNYLKLLEPRTLLLSVIATILPDFDIKFKHRALFHNIFATLISTAIVFLYFGTLGAIFFALAYFSHLLLDSLTKAGVSILYPISKRRYGFRLFRNGSLFDKFLFLSFTVAFTLLFIKRFSSVKFTEFLKEILLP